MYRSPKRAHWPPQSEGINEPLWVEGLMTHERERLRDRPANRKITA